MLSQKRNMILKRVINNNAFYHYFLHSLIPFCLGLVQIFMWVFLHFFLIQNEAESLVIESANIV